MTAAIIFLWYASTVAKIATIGLLCQRRLGRHYPALLAFLTFATIRNISLWFAGDDYPVMWGRAQWLSVAVYAAVTLEIHLAYARHFPQSATVAWALGGVFATLAAGVACATAGIGVPADWQAHPARAALLERGFSLACGIAVIGSSWAWGLFRSVAIRPNVERYATIMAVYFACRFAADAIVMLSGGAYWWVAAAQVIGVGGPLGCYMAMAVMLVPSGERS